MKAATQSNGGSVEENCGLVSRNIESIEPIVNETPALSYALRFASQGWRILPCAPKSKTPLIPWTTGSSSNPDTIRAWAERHPGCNFAVHCGPSDLVVLDEDNKTTDNHGASSLSWLFTEKDISFTDGTLKVATPNGGYHYYFSGRCRQTSKLYYEGRELKGLETKAGNGFLLLPGSEIKVNGIVKRYELVHDVTLAPVPDILVILAGGLPDRPGERAKAPDDVALDDPAAVAWARHYLTHDAPEAPAGERSNRVYEVACRLRDKGLTEGVVAELMAEVYSPLKVYPPAPAADIHRIVGNAFRYAQNELGVESCDWTAPIDWNHPLLSVDQDTPVEPLDLEQYRGDFILDTTPEDIPFLTIAPLSIPMGCVTILYGPGGSLKTCFAECLAVHVATGLETAPGVISTMARGPVLIISGEDPRAVVHKRVSALLEQFRDQAGWAEAEEAFRANFYLAALDGARLTWLGLAVMVSWRSRRASRR